MVIPKPYCSNKSQIKAFVLGCDPTGFKNGNRLEFEYVFDLRKDKRYFAGILSNLKQIGLSLEDVYVQNLITDYQEKESSKNKEWLKTAKKFIPVRKKEFDDVDPEQKLPVLLTSELLYKALLSNDQPKYSAKKLYENPDLIPIPSKANKLERPLISLYRHKFYLLKKWDLYRVALTKIIEYI